MQGIYSYIPETNHVPREHGVATIIIIIIITVKCIIIIIIIIIRDGPGIESQWGRSFTHPSKPALGPTRHPVHGGRFFPGGKTAGA